MIEGDVALTPLPQKDGQSKPRPVILLRKVPPFGDWLVCGISTQLHQHVPGFDEIIEPSQPDFVASGLKAASLIRLGFLVVLPANRLFGVIGTVSRERLHRVQQRLATFLLPNQTP
jgi:mRNA interferase MazF